MPGLVYSRVRPDAAGSGDGGAGLSSAVYFALLGFVCGIAGFRIGWRLPTRLALPLVQGAFGFVGFAAAWRAGGAPLGALAVGAWAVGATAVSIPAFRLAPEEADRRLLRAASYRRGMLGWLRTGRVPEGGPAATALAHARRLAVYLVAALLTGNFLSLALGADLLNTMNAYVASLLRAARRPWVVALLGWNVWSLARVAAYVLLGSACATPAFSWMGWPRPPGEVGPVLVAGAAGVVLDLALKVGLAARCAAWLGSAVDLDAASHNRALH